MVTKINFNGQERIAVILSEKVNNMSKLEISSLGVILNYFVGYHGGNYDVWGTIAACDYAMGFDETSIAEHHKITEERLKKRKK